MNLYIITIMSSVSHHIFVPYSTYEELLKENDKLKCEVYGLKGRIGAITENAIIKIAEIEELKVSIISINEKIENISITLKTLNQSIDISRLTQDNCNMWSDINRLSVCNAQLSQDNYTMYNKIMYLESKYKYIEEDNINLKSDICILKEENVNLKSDICILKEENINLKSDICILKEENKVLKEENKVLKEENKVLKEENKVLKNDICILKNEITQLKSDAAYEKYRNNLLMSIQDVNAAKQLEKNVIYPYNTLFRLNRSKRVTNSHFIIEDDDENTLNHKYYALLQYLKSLPADIKKTFDKHIDKTEKFSIIDKVIEILSEHEYNNIDTELLDDCLNWFLC